MTIDQILDELETIGKRKTPRLIWESVLYYYASIMLNKYNFRKNVGSKPFIRYYSIIFASSGVGKSFVLNQIENMCGLEQYPGAMTAFYRDSLSRLPEIPEDRDEVLRYMPKSVTIGVEGTAEGLFYVTKSQVGSMFGSLNLATEEFGEAIASSSGLLSKLKELYDGQFKAKIIKGDADSEMKSDINNIICNFIGLGSRKGVTHEAEKELKRIASSGMYRRTFIIDSKELVEKNKTETKINKTTEYLNALNENYKAEFKHRRTIDLLGEVYMKTTAEFDEELEKIDDDLIDRAHSDKLNEFAQYNTGSLEMVIDLAHIIAFIEWDHEVTADHLRRAYNFMVRTRTSVEDTFKSVHPYKLMYDLLKLKDNMTISEMAELEGIIPTAKNKIADAVAMLEELCYRKDEVLHKSEGKVTRYRIETLPVNKLDKLIVSVHNEGEKEFAINFQPWEIDWDQLKKMVKSEKIESFCTAHFNPSKQAPAGHREAKSYIEGANIVAFDIDDGMTISEAEELLKDYKYLIYTSKSHNTEKYEFRDRFRIILPTKNTFYVTPDQHKNLYINIENFLGIKNNDVQTRNTSRLWYTNPNAILHENEGQLLDVTFLLPSTDKSDDYIPKMNEINEAMDSGEISKREAGFTKWFLMNTSVGNRHDMLTKAYYFFRDIGLDPDQKVTQLNAMLADPYPDHEMKFIYSIGRKS